MFSNPFARSSRDRTGRRQETDAMDHARYTTALAEIIIEFETDAHDAAIARAHSEREAAALRDDVEVLLAEIAPWEETAQRHAQNIAVATETVTEARQQFYALIDDEYEQLCATEQPSNPPRHPTVA